MKLRELLDHTRHSVLSDTRTPQQWDDGFLRKSLNDAQAIFARRTFCLLDSESAFTTLTTVATEDLVELDPLVLHVFWISNSAGTKLKRLSPLMHMRTTSREPYAWSERGNHAVGFYPVPDDAYTFNMLVARLPLTEMSKDEDTPEIPEQYHLNLCDWAAYRALRSVDAGNSDGVRNTMIDVRKDWERAVVEAKREFYQNQRGY